MSPSLDIQKVAVIGCGSMGGNMALLFAEKGIDVSLQDPDEKTMDNIVSAAKKQGFGERVKQYNDYDSLCASLSSPKVLIFSLPHGSVGDTVLSGLTPYLNKGDIIIDCGNEHWENTERRQGKSVTRGIRYVGAGVSGGYQAARLGPSICPGGDDESLDCVMPFLEKVAAKDDKGRSCVGKVGTGGSGHYVKMVHNGVEHGMMCAISEAWGIMEKGLGMSFEEIGQVFDDWNKDGPLAGTFLVAIGARICRTRNDAGKKVLSEVEDKVVQDVTGEEGTGIWSNAEGVSLHVPAPTLTTAHYLRLASAYRDTRILAQETIGGGFEPQRFGVNDHAGFINYLRTATYLACLVSYIQGINIIEQADKENGWNIDYSAVLQIWRAGCIIQADHISSLLRPEFVNFRQRKSMNLLFEPRVMKELRSGFDELKRVILAATEADHIVPSLSASLEYIKYETNTNLPTQFYEAELDLFGKHMFDKKDEPDTGGPTEGRHHFEWKPAKGAA
ncbi:6-phosphogluconate dehydrogenase C-terminal domain-like protein [Rhizodiscina lignyota]|uniref:6-phosphogluconate dehydrogenase, decarboxylating n=1 Tax=Rhizodiscina lignyota TaxID=1504668 RepID=A0A9P4I8P1_9PEZI|nr:6-phosphogluconate dehydrogenase C-terminal domain-like protein [Rhizodiscina lignyota]